MVFPSNVGVSKESDQKTSIAAMNETLRYGFSTNQLKDVDFDSIVAKIYGQEPQKALLREPSLDKMKISDGNLNGDLTFDGLSVISKNNDVNGHGTKEALQYLSAQSNGYDEIFMPSASTVVDGVIPMAIIGMSCRFPGGATDISKLWNLVSEGRSAWSKVPESRFNVDAFYHSNPDRASAVSFPELNCLAARGIEQ